MNVRCPFCDRWMVSAWECLDPAVPPRWFAGVYGCGKCGAIKISGSVDGTGAASARSVIPECPNHHGTNPVVQLGVNRWRCTACNAEILRDDGDLTYRSEMGWRDLDHVLLATEGGAA